MEQQSETIRQWVEEIDFGKMLNDMPHVAALWREMQDKKAFYDRQAMYAKSLKDEYHAAQVHFEEAFEEAVRIARGEVESRTPLFDAADQAPKAATTTRADAQLLEELATVLADVAPLVEGFDAPTVEALGALTMAEIAQVTAWGQRLKAHVDALAEAIQTDGAEVEAPASEDLIVPACLAVPGHAPKVESIESRRKRGRKKKQDEATETSKPEPVEATEIGTVQ